MGISPTVIAAGVSAGGSLLSGLFGKSSADKAGQAQAAAAQAAIAEQRRQYETTRADLAPYRGYGETAGNMLMARLPELTQNWSPTQENLEATPGYQFTRDQGLKAVQNSAAARGLGVSGAAMKGAATYATGLADSTWQNVFNADQTQKNNIYSKLYGTTALGETAASQTATAGTSSANAISNTLMQNGNNQGAADIAGGNALTRAINGVGGAAMFEAYTRPGGLFGPKTNQSGNS